MRRNFTPALAAVACAVAASLAAAPASAAAPGGALAFTSYRGGAAHVWGVNADGSGLRQLTQTAQPAFEGSPAYSPDGRLIAYVCGNFELCLMNADGSAQTRLTTTDWPREFRYDRSPSWSPDGRRIVFVRSSGHDQLWVINADGSDLRQIPVADGFNDNPVFSPDSKTIAYDHADEQSGPDSDVVLTSESGVFAVGVDSGAPRRLTPETVDASDPAWSPDGGRIAFDRETDSGTRIYVMNAGGGGMRRAVAKSFTLASGAAWSPDGTRIAFAGSRGGKISLYDVASAGGAARRLTSGSGPDLDPVWQPVAATAGAVLPSPVAPPSLPASDALVVGALFKAGIDLLAGLSPGILSDRPTTAARAATALSSVARRIRAATLRLQPATARGAKVRRTLLQATTIAKAIVKELRAAVRSLRRHDKKAARRQRRDVLLGFFGLGLTLAEGGNVAGLPLATI